MPTSHVTATRRATTATAHDISRFRTLVDDAFVPLQIDGARGDAFRGMLRGAEAGHLHLSDLVATAHTVQRTPALIARGRAQAMKVSLMLSGHCQVIQDGREAELGPGDLAVYDTDRPYTLAFDGDVRTMIALFPRTAIPLPTTSLDELTAVRIGGTDGLGAVISPFLSQLTAHLEQLAGASGTRLADSTLDLVTTTLAARIGDEPDAHARRRRRIHDHIDAHLGDDLTPASIAAAHFISLRHLHALFQEDGTSVATWIRTRRLERCRRDLEDPLQRDTPVAAVGARWGFPDAAHFSRTFKASFGQSPRGYRDTH